jgi:hypothetical protein
MPTAPVQVDDIRLSDFTSRLTTKEILATTAVYGPWTPAGEFDWHSHASLVRDVLSHDAIPATNVEATGAQHNSWELCRQIAAETARVAGGFADCFHRDRPLLVVGLNTNAEDLTARKIAPALRLKVEALHKTLRGVGVERVRYMPLPDKRLRGAPRRLKVEVYREIGKVVADFTDHGMVLCELNLGMGDFGSDFDLADIAEILAGVPQIQEYHSAATAPKPGPWAYDCDFRGDLARIMLVEQGAADRVKFSTGNEWCIALARCGRNLPQFGYLLGASQISPARFQQWRQLVEADDPSAIPLEQDLQAAARDFWTAGSLGVHRHYLGILLALCGKIGHPTPHPDCAPRFRVRPEAHWLPLKHAIRLGLLRRDEAPARARQFIPGAESMSDARLEERIQRMG